MHWRRRCRQVLQKEFHETQPSSQQQIHLYQVLIPTHRRGNYSALLRSSTLLLNHEHRAVHFHGWWMQVHEYCQSWKIPEGIARFCNGASQDMTRWSWPFLAGRDFGLRENCMRNGQKGTTQRWRLNFQVTYEFALSCEQFWFQVETLYILRC